MEDAEEGQPFLSGKQTTPDVIRNVGSPKRRLLDWAWVISTLIFASLSVFLYVQCLRIEAYERGFSTDLGMAAGNDRMAPSNHPLTNKNNKIR